MAYKSEDETHVAFELVSMRNGRSSLSFENSPAAVAATTSTSVFPAVSPERTNVSANSPSATSNASQTKRANVASTSKSKAEDAPSPSEPKTKKRRRVVVACDTCRRKKIKCEGLPNPTNTCNNCTAYNYRCTFSSDADRSRGKYEILESKVETLLSALRSVAPHVARQFERGELNVTGPSGSSAPPQNANSWQTLEAHTSSHPAKKGDDDDDSHAYDPANRDSVHSRHDNDLPSHSAVRFARGESDPEEGDATFNNGDNAGSAAEAAKREDRDALLPDVEDGRPK